jgi:hypothetical protein
MCDDGPWLGVLINRDEVIGYRTYFVTSRREMRSDTIIYFVHMLVLVDLRITSNNCWKHAGHNENQSWTVGILMGRWSKLGMFNGR